jgi:predicted DNA-binding ribbon-helix-helix protein
MNGDNAESTLVSRNIVVDGRRTSVRLEQEMWEALREIAVREGVSIHDICTMVDAERRESSLTAGMRVFIMSYFRTAATESGHVQAGHGERSQDQRAQRDPLSR